MLAILAVLFILAVLGAPFWPWGRASWGYYPSGGLLLVLVVIVLVLALQGGGGSVGANVTSHGCNARW